MNLGIKISLFFQIFTEEIILFASNFLICLLTVILVIQANLSNSQIDKKGFENNILVVL
ncbi:MAG: hypothetical protein LBU14_06270 [Candidatus Peribacteria bacterium]|jgi:hypothetical protein|nr:hypothetical protein [Candidatus Peribacteria bacterium]